MKIVLFWTLCLVIGWSAHANDTEKLYPQLVAQAKTELYNLAFEYFKGPDSLVPGEILTPAMVTSRKRHDDFYQIKRLVGIAQDLDIQVDYLQEFGFLLVNQHTYQVDFSDYPQWAENKTLFHRFDSFNPVSSMAYYMRKKGLSDDDIAKIHDFVSSNHPSVFAELELIKLIADQQKRLQPIFDAYSKNPSKTTKAALIQAAITTNELWSRNRYNSWNQWSTDLLNQLDPQKQILLIKYLQEGGLGKMQTSGSGVNEYTLLISVENILSGKTQKNLANRLMKLLNDIEYNKKNS